MLFGIKNKNQSYAYNLLDNSDFRNPVNQRGATGSFGTWTYTLDRWTTANNNSTISLGDNGLNLQGGLLQIIKVSKFPKKYTIASKIDGVVYCMSGTFTNANAWVRIAQVETVNAILSLDDEGNGNGVLHIQVKCNVLSVVEWVAMYEGEYTAETLPPYYPKGYAHELLECQKYYVKVPHAHIVGMVTSSSLEYYIPIDLTMRAKPTVVGCPTFKIRLATGGYSSHTYASFVPMTNIKVNGVELYNEFKVVAVYETISTAKDINNSILYYEITDLELSADL